MKIALYGNSYQKAKSEHVLLLFEALRKYDIELFIEKKYFEFLSEQKVYIPSAQTFDVLEYNVDVVLSVGGDGTFLRTAEQTAGLNIPILGINAGRLGFLADVSKTEIETAVEELMNGNYNIDERTMLQIEVDGLPSDCTPYALNEVAVLKQDSSSMITINATLGNDFLNSYQADGLIVATPTGSTGYSLSVGGPILMPESADFVISPVAPHTLNVRPLVIPDNQEIKLLVDSRTGNYLVALDGRSYIMPCDKEIKLSKAPFKTLVVKRTNHTFPVTLRNKLMWGVDNRN
ncbi:MAG: NAD kinase [Bacteroidales bacterium]|nr:NAD kinase [Bacteroidales bacterium]